MSMLRSRLYDASLMRGFRDQFVQALKSRLFFLRTDNPPVHNLAVRRWLGLEKLPRRFVSFEFSQIRLDQFRTSLFVRIDAGSVFFASSVGSDPSGLHAIFLEQSV